MNGQTNSVSILWIQLSNEKKQIIHTTTWTSLQGMEKPILKGHTKYDSIHIPILKLQNYGNGEEISDCQGSRTVAGEIGTIKSQHEEGSPCGDRTVLYLDCIDVNILTVMLYYSFVRCYHWEKLGKGYTGSLYIISQNCMLISNYFKIKKFN